MFQRNTLPDLNRLAPRRICLIKPSALGDVVQTIPLLPALKLRFPEAEISWVVNRELRDLVDGHPCLNESIPFDRKGTWTDWLRTLNTLQQRKFDCLIDLQGLLRTAVMTVATRSPIRIGLETAREGSAFTLNHTIPASGRAIPAHARYWRVAEALGVGDIPRETFIATSKSDETWAESVLRDLPRPIFAVHPGARWETKRWPPEKFAELMIRADKAWSGTTLLLGSKAELPDATRVEQQIQTTIGATRSTRVVNLCGKSNLKQLSALLKRVDFAISNDSGPMHLAAGLGAPTLGLFTCTSAVRSGPPGDEHELVSTTVPCAASYHKKCPHSGTGHLACFRELNHQRVWVALERLVAKSRCAKKIA